MSATSTWYLSLAVFGALIWQSVRLMRLRNHLVLLIWPAFIYLIGPTATLMFLDHPVLSRYMDEKRVAVQTLQMGWYILLLLIADRLVGLGASLKESLSGLALQRLAQSPLFPAIFLASGLMAAALQGYTLMSFGTIFTGTYILDEAADGIPYWGFLAGLYEIVFLCFILVLVGKRPSRRIWWLYVGLYTATTALRVLGGTRLILIKELAFMIILFYLRGAIKPRQMLVVGALVVAAGSAVAFLRSGGGDDASGVLGPLYGLVMESALNALTLGVADQVNQSGAVAANGGTLTSIAFFALSVVPSFLRFGVSERDMAALNPYNLALTSGFDTSAPVGGMSGFATIDYLSSYPMLFVLAMVTVFSLWFALLRHGPFKQMFGLVILVNAIHFWRDPADIAFKLVVQGMVICALLYLVPPRRRRQERVGATPSLVPSLAHASDSR